MTYIFPSHIIKVLEEVIVPTQPIPIKKYGKQEREKRVLLGLVEHYLNTGEAVGSETLKEAGFEELSSATIRNYFGKLEKEGYLQQQHSSGGRIPTDKAFRLYANEYLDSHQVSDEIAKILHDLRKNEEREIALYLHQSAETLSKMTNLAVFLAAPRFDQDMVTDLKLVQIDQQRLLTVIITEFGTIQSEIIHTDHKLSNFTHKRIEEYFQCRLTGREMPEHLGQSEKELAQNLYNELMVRYIVRSSNFVDEDIYRTGLSCLLNYAEFHSTKQLAIGLGLFENRQSMRIMLRECVKRNNLQFWIGEDLTRYTHATPHCAVIAIPYRIGPNIVGAVGVLGPSRMPYRQLFGILRLFSESVSEALTRNIYKFKIQYREPHQDTNQISGTISPILLEDKTNNDKEKR